MQNRVDINPFDQDAIRTAGGAAVGYTINTSERYNGYYLGTDSANSSSYKFTRFFGKGGLYKVRFIYSKNTDAAKADIGLDSTTTALFSQVDGYNASQTYNNVIEMTKEISRGYHDITFLANGKNASSSNYKIYNGGLQFDLVQEYPVYQDDKPAQINHGGLVLLSKHKAVVAESTFTFNLADITDTKYSEVLVVVRGGQTAALSLLMKVNGLSATYFGKGITSDGTTVSAVNISGASSWTMLVGTGANIISGHATLKHSNGQIMGESIFGEGTGTERTLSIYQSGSGFPLSSIVISTSTSTWVVGTEIEIWGRNIQ